MEEKIIKEAIKAIPYLRKFPSYHMWVDYDEEADVMYISFEKPQNATDSQLLDNDVILRKRNGKTVGLTILNASKARF